MRKRGSLLTPEVVDAIARNAEALNTAMNNGSEKTVLGLRNNGPVIGDEDCCSPRFIKFKFILCDVEINNENSAAQEEQTPVWKPSRHA